MVKLIDKIRKVEIETRQRFLTCEADIVFALFETPLTSGELFEMTRNANTSFYQTLKRLHDQNVVTKKRDPNDKRLSRYYLSETMMNALIDHVGACFTSTKPDNTENNIPCIPTEFNNITLLNGKVASDRL